MTVTQATETSATDSDPIGPGPGHRQGLPAAAGREGGAGRRAAGLVRRALLLCGGNQPLFIRYTSQPHTHTQKKNEGMRAHTRRTRAATHAHKKNVTFDR